MSYLRLIRANTTWRYKGSLDGGRSFFNRFGQGGRLIGHDALLLHSGTVRADCGRDCLKSNNAEPGLGYVYAADGYYDLTAGTDAIQAEGRLLITGGTYHMLCGGGYVYPAELESRKGIKAIEELVITGGVFDINSSDDALHADKRMSLRGGSYTLYAGDDAILATELYAGSRWLLGIYACLGRRVYCFDRRGNLFCPTRGRYVDRDTAGHHGGGAAWRPCFLDRRG